MRVADRMTKDPRTCAPDTLLYDARDIMRQGSFRRLPVMAVDALVGVVTDRDIRSFLLPEDLPERVKERIELLKVRRVGDIMTPDPITIAPDASLERASEIFRIKKFSGLPVLENGKLAGVISTRDVMEGLLEGLGAHRDSFRFTIEISKEKTDALSQFLHIMAARRAIILNVLSDFKIGRDRGMIHYSIRVERADPKKLLPYLEEIGVKIVEVITESATDGL